MERVRSVRIQAKNGGRPCEATSESASCGNEACDQDCKLTAWTRWGTCSKACDGGFQVRNRHVAANPKGQGSCPGSRSSDRLQYRRCNSHICAPKHSDVLECVAKLDVVLLLDGSGSMGQEGWEATKQASQKLVRAFKTGENAAQVAVLLFSGPSNWAAYKKCTQSGGAGTVDLVKDCKIIWVSHFTTNTTRVANDVGMLKWPKATTLTSAALASAQAELRSGRASARSVVIVITDGRPLNPRKTFQAARSLRSKARVLWVPVAKYAPLDDIKTWASRPVADNVLVLRDFKDLGKAATVNRIIADACPKVE